MNRINIGCGPDIKDGWTNADSHPWEGSVNWDILNPPRVEWVKKFDLALVNHTLCLLGYDEVDVALGNIMEVLVPGGVIEVIDMDVLKAFDNFNRKNKSGFAGLDESFDSMLCKHLVGYGRKSIYTAQSMKEKLEKAGFKRVYVAQGSADDLRPEESFVVRGVK